MNTEYEFAMFYNNFISDLLQKPHTLEMHQLLLNKKAQSDKEIVILYQTCYNRKFYLEEIKDLKKIPNHLYNLVSNENIVINIDCLLLHQIGQLPEDLIKLIGSYSPHVKNQKSLIRIEFYDNWFKINKKRIISLLTGWSKVKLAFALNNIRSQNNPYYNCCLKGMREYRKGTSSMFKSRIETLIEEKGKRSNMEQYSLLLAIEKYDKRK